jgi:hypothetical protein
MGLFKSAQNSRSIQTSQEILDDEVHTFDSGFNRLAGCLVATLTSRIPMIQAQTAFQLKKEWDNIREAFL